VTRFKLDENLPSRAALVLRQAGHDASTVIEEGLGGASHTTLAEACADEDLVLLERSAQVLGKTSLRGGISILEPHRIRSWRAGD